ncbi:hypothetical protein A0J61_03270, partial [Choanephora cucurbitarum]
TWSEVSSIPVNELNIMEMEFLSALNYTIHLPQDDFYAWVNQCQQWWNRPQLAESQNDFAAYTTAAATAMMVAAAAAAAAAINHHTPTIHSSSPPIRMKRSFDEEQPHYKKRFTDYNVCKPILSWSSSIPISQPDPYSTPTTPANTNIYHYLPFVSTIESDILK